MGNSSFANCDWFLIMKDVPSWNTQKNAFIRLWNYFLHALRKSQFMMNEKGLQTLTGIVCTSLANRSGIRWSLGQNGWMQLFLINRCLHCTLEKMKAFPLSLPHEDSCFKSLERKEVKEILINFQYIFWVCDVFNTFGI